MKWKTEDTVAVVILAITSLGTFFANLRGLVDTQKEYGVWLNILLIFIGLSFAIFSFVLARYGSKNEQLREQITRQADPDCEKDLLCRSNFKKILEKYRIKDQEPNTNTIIYNNVTPLTYSIYSEGVTKGNNVKKIFTVFAFDPVYFFRLVAEEMKESESKYSTYNLEDNNQLLEFIKTNEYAFWSYLNSNYPHFQKFEELNSLESITVTRLLIKVGKYWMKRNLDFLEYFMKLGLTCEQIKTNINSNILCYIIDEKYLKGGDYLLSDHVTYEEEEDALLATYDIEAKTLLITPEKANSMSDKLINHFDRNKANNEIYQEINSFIRTNNPKYKSHLYKDYSKISELPTIQKIIEKQVDIIVNKKPKTILSIGIGYGDELNSMLSKLDEKYSFLFDKIVGIDINSEVGANLNDKFNVEKATKNLVEYSTDDKFDCVQCSFVIHDIKDEEDKLKAFQKFSELLKDNGTLLISEMLINNQIESDYNKDLKRKNQIDKLYINVMEEVHTLIESKVNKKEKLEYKNLINKLLEIKEDARQVKRDYFIDKSKIEQFLLKSNFTDIEVFPISYKFAVIYARKKA